MSQYNVTGIGIPLSVLDLIPTLSSTMHARIEFLVANKHRRGMTELVESNVLIRIILIALTLICSFDPLVPQFLYSLTGVCRGIQYSLSFLRIALVLVLVRIALTRRVKGVPTVYVLATFHPKNENNQFYSR